MDYFILMSLSYSDILRAAGTPNKTFHSHRCGSAELATTDVT